MISRMYSEGTAYGGNDRGTLPNRKLPSIVAKAVEPTIKINPEHYFDRKGNPIAPGHERWGEWNDDTDELLAKKYPGFDPEEEQGKLRKIGYYVLDNTPIGMTHPDEDDFAGALPFFREHWPELAKNKKYTVHPRTETYLKDPKAANLPIEEYGSDDLLGEQWNAVAKQLYGGY
jgi:hypothetical protein